MGVDMNSSQVVYQMWQDAIHLDTMISPRYRHIGAGVASNDNYVFYTIDVGYIAGEPGTGDGGSPPGEAGTPGAAGTPGPAEIAMVPIALATPRVDGSIIHVVEWGQFLVNLAEAYEVPLADLLALNGINQDTVIYEGDKLLVKVGVTSVSAAEGTSQPNGSGAGIGTGTPQGPENRKPTETPSANEKLPTRTLTPAFSLAIARAGTVENPAQSTPNLAAIIPTVEKEELPSAAQGEGSDYLLIAVLGLAVSGTALVLMGSALKRA
jgi:LysM repeat protein